MQGAGLTPFGAENEQYRIPPSTPMDDAGDIGGRSGCQESGRGADVLRFAEISEPDVLLGISATGIAREQPADLRSID
jgi:hypothetical protein